MAANLIDLALDLAKLAPHTLPKLSGLLKEQAAVEQQGAGGNPPSPSAQPVQRQPQQPVRPGAPSGPVLKFVSGPAAPIVRSTNRPISPEQQREVQTLMATARAVPPQQVKITLLTVARERQREAKVMFFFICVFFGFCLLILALGIVLLFLKNTTAAGGILTTLGTILSGVGGLLLKSRQDTNQSLDDIIGKIQQS